ncbi:MAG: URC4/urg3 family protein [Elainellaceae cyanobacterium]
MPVNSAQPSPSLEGTIAYLRSPQAIRDRCTQLFKLALDGQLEYFDLDLTRLPQVADYVTDITRHTYPDLEIPFHSRWRHFEVGGSARLNAFYRQIQSLGADESVRAAIDLAIVSVLLDAGAGQVWHFHEAQTGQVWGRSEGLAIASFHLFCSGAFSSDPQQPLRVDAQALRHFSLEQLATGFQVTEANPLVGLEGRLHLLQKLGKALERSPQLFGTAPARPGNLVDALRAKAVPSSEADGTSTTHILKAEVILAAVLDGFSSIWPGRVVLDGVNLGDVWPHPALPQVTDGANLVPFHKLSQWLTYSLIEPLQQAGLTVVELDRLTGLPEYRNGGLFVDFGVLCPKQATVTQQHHAPGSSIIVEWRALTVILLDRLAPLIRDELQLSATELPLARVLQGGTWSAGRSIARDRRSDGSPPIQIDSDGTVF